MHAVVTIAVHDMNGFAELGKVNEQTYHDAPEGPSEIDECHTLLLDLWSDDGVIDNKYIDLDTAAELLDWPTEGLLQRGRQILAAREDELWALWRDPQRRSHK